MGTIVKMEEHISRKKSLAERLREHPQLRARLEALLDVVEDVAGDVVKADEAEQRVLEELRRCGQEALQAWAEQQHERQVRYWEARAGVCRKEKKDSTGTRASEPLSSRNNSSAADATGSKFAPLPGVRK